jgi:hypothetical protein
MAMDVLKGVVAGSEDIVELEKGEAGKILVKPEAPSIPEDEENAMWSTRPLCCSAKKGALFINERINNAKMKNDGLRRIYEETEA